MNEKQFEVARKIHESISRDKKVFEPKKRFLNWDPVAIMRGEEFNPNEIIRKTEKIQSALKKGEEMEHDLMQLPKNEYTPASAMPLLPLKVRTREEFDQD